MEPPCDRHMEHRRKGLWGGQARMAHIWGLPGFEWVGVCGSLGLQQGGERCETLRCTSICWV
jgi:hypothetical protein